MEEEEESRNYSVLCKITEPTIDHSKYSCIGSSTCLKQKNIKKAFPLILQLCKKSADESDKIEAARKLLRKSQASEDNDGSERPTSS